MSYLSSKVSLRDCINVMGTPSKSEYVVIEFEDNAGCRLAQQGGFLEHMGGEFYKCKRIVANNLSLKIISDYPLTIK